MTAIRGNISRDLNIVLICLTSAIITLRFYVRGYMTKNLALDDAFALVAVCTVFAQSSLDILIVSYGAGTPQADLPLDTLKKFFSVLPTMELLFFVTTCFVRLTIIAFLPRLSRERKVRLIAVGLGLFTITVSVVCFMIMLFECKHVPDLWDTFSPTRQCLSQNRERLIFFAHGSAGVLVDLCLLVIPIWIIYSRMLFSATTKRVMLVFSVGAFVLLAGCVRLGVIAALNFADDTPFNFIKSSVWTDLEVHIGLWVACFPTLQPLIRIALRKVGLTTQTMSTNKKTAPAIPNATNDIQVKRKTGVVNVNAARISGMGVFEKGISEKDLFSDSESGMSSPSSPSGTSRRSENEMRRMSTRDGETPTLREQVSFDKKNVLNRRHEEREADVERDAVTERYHVYFPQAEPNDPGVSREEVAGWNILATTDITVRRI